MSTDGYFKKAQLRHKPFRQRQPQPHRNEGLRLLQISTLNEIGLYLESKRYTLT